MRILMFGRGVIATIYGGLLQSAGHEVEFYVRPGRASEYGDEVELDLIDARRTLLGTRVRHQLRLRMRESLDPDDAFDLIVLSVGHHQLSTACGTTLSTRPARSRPAKWLSGFRWPAAASGPTEFCAAHCSVG